MNSPTNDTALLLFTRSSTAEAAHKNILGSRQAAQNRRLLDQMIRHSRLNAKQSGLPFFIHTEKDQKGQHFGERLTQSLDFVFRQGFFKILVMGNDCLSLSPGQLKAAAAAITEDKVVLGPTRSGGVYLIGVHLHQFEPRPFAALNWQTTTLFQELCQLMETAGHLISTLPVQTDINDRKSLEHQLNHLCPTNAFRTFAQSLLAGLQHPIVRGFGFLLPNFSYTSAGLRAPPVVG